MAQPTSTESDGDGRAIRDLLHHITADVKTIAKGEIELAKDELGHSAKAVATDAAVILLGGIVVLIGFGMLCVAAVAALQPLIHALSLRLLLMAAVYLVGGAMVAAVFAKRLKSDAKPHLAVSGYEAKRTIAGIKSSLQHS